MILNTTECIEIKRVLRTRNIECISIVSHIFMEARSDQKGAIGLFPAYVTVTLFLTNSSIFHVLNLFNIKRVLKCKLCKFKLPKLFTTM